MYLSPLYQQRGEKIMKVSNAQHLNQQQGFENRANKIV